MEVMWASLATLCESNVGNHIHIENYYHFQTIEANDEAFWQAFWTEHNTASQDVFALIPANEIRALKRDNPTNLATLCYKATERLVLAVDNSCRSQLEHQAVLNCIRLLQRIIPYIFEDEEWRKFFWSQLPTANEKDNNSTPLAQSLLNVICVGGYGLSK